jgi:outer membrane protein OmpA-like peptidoglycan-associated protein
MRPLSFLFFLLQAFHCIAQLDSSIYRNDFSKPEMCLTPVNESYGKSWCKDGKFHTEFYDTTKTWTQPITLTLPGDDYSLEMAVMQAKGAGTHGYGIAFGHKDYKNTNYFVLSSSGYFQIHGYDNELPYKLQEWKTSAAIKGPGNTNYIAIRKKGDNYFFYINSVEVASVPVQKIRLYANAIGIVTQGKMTLDVDYVYLFQKRKKINLADKWEKFGKKERLSPQINSTAHEKHPLISPDGMHLYINRVGHPGNVGAIDKADIWVSDLMPDSTWGPLKNLGAPLNNKGYNFIQAVSADNSFILVGGVYSSDLQSMSDGYSIAAKTKTGWAPPKKLTIKNYSNTNEYASATLSADGKVLVLSAEREDSNGESDLYVSFKNPDNSWSEPKNLGSTVNTYAQDYTPFLAPDGFTLYFASFGHPGYGSADIFMTKRLDESWKNWTAPVNMGPKINGKGWDAYYSVDTSGVWAYICSTENSENNEDIYRIKTPKAPPAPPLGNVSIHGKVINDKTKEALGAEIKLLESTTGNIVQTLKANETTGEYAFVLKKAGKYDIAGFKEGFISLHKTIEIKEVRENKDIRVDLALTPIETGATIVLKNIFFTPNKFDLLPESFEELNKLVKIMKENPQIKIQVSGHTSKNNEGEQFNEELSTNRALAVKTYLLQNGVDAMRVVHKGYGFSKPLYIDEGQEHQAMNRRVEFTILSK